MKNRSTVKDLYTPSRVIKDYGFYKDHDNIEGYADRSKASPTTILQPAYFYDNYCSSVKARISLTDISNCLTNHHIILVEQS